MSSALYATRLLWTGRLGIAKHKGVHVELTSRPRVLLDLHIGYLDLIPEVGLARVQEIDFAQRDLTPAEVAQCKAYLQRVAFAALLEIERDYT